ncbi:MAG: 16S rRNA (adenine(1518)-N(6)/adenine(1519)-N(6))-dimethyltransferase RsmA [Candidatus Sedimenticola sp. (ex Thyasira tokunagai)]
MSHKARKRFGQNFLHDQGVISRIVRSIVPREGEHLVEIGPGQGAITKELLRAAGALDAVELDRDLIQPLTEMCADLGQLHLHSADALKFDFCSLVENEKPLRLVGNLPYNISTPIIFHLLKQSHCISDMHFMLQKEVVDRMAAEPGSKVYGRLTVMLQTLCSVESLFEIGPGAFKPAPKVNSALVRLVPYEKPPYAISDRAFFAQMVTAAFSQRRKTLRNSLRDLVDTETMTEAGIESSIRAERLTLEEFVTLSNLACKKH